MLKQINNFVKIYILIQVHQFNVIMELMDNFAKILITLITLEHKNFVRHLPAK